MNVFGNSSNVSENKNDTGLFVRKTNLKESIIEEDIILENQFRIKNLPNPMSIREACIDIYVDNIFENDIDFNDVKVENL